MLAQALMPALLTTACREPQVPSLQRHRPIANTPTPTPTPVSSRRRRCADLKRLQQAALSSDYAYKQVAHLADNIGPRLSGSAQAAKAIEYVASELKAIGCEVQLGESDGAALGAR